MIIHNYLKTPLRDERIHDGEGLCRHATVFEGTEIDAPVQFINYTVIPPAAGFGLHRHGNNNEFYVILAGKGIYIQDGEEQAVEAGDIIMNAPGAVHGIRNTGETDMPVLVFEANVCEGS